ncbi:MAG: HupE/UreJ family protein [Burkholderiales bacterium]
MRAPPAAPLAGVLALATAAVPAFAHDGHLHDGLAAGLAHPLGGVDHLLATLGIGVVAGLVAARPVGAGRESVGARVVLAGALGLVAGALWSMLSDRMPGLVSLPGGIFEAAAALGLLAIAAAQLRVERIAAGGLAALALAVALPHGWLHASEGAGAAFFGGLALASAALYAAGLGLGRAIAVLRVERARWVAAAGYAAAFGWLASAAFR